MIEFVCNICGVKNALPMEAFDRETGLCASCGSTVRQRSVIYLLTKYLVGSPQVLPLMPTMGFRGIGLSCASSYAPYLAQKFDYTNTFFDGEPFLDINNPADSDPAESVSTSAVEPAEKGGATRPADGGARRKAYENLDFVISSDVFEHTMPPAIAAFEGTRRILKTGGLLFLTVPYSLNEETVEHYPECTEYEEVDLDDGRRGVRLTLRDGSTVLDENPTWHGGAGNTLEMRVLCQRDLWKLLEDASFEVAEVFRYGVPEFGLLTTLGETWSLPIVARKRRRSLRHWLRQALVNGR